MLNANWSCFMISTLYTALDPRSCRNFARTSATGDALVVLVGDCFPAWMTILGINCFSSSRVGWILWTVLSHGLRHSPLLNYLFILLVILILDPFLWLQQKKGLVVHNVWQRCQCSPSHKITQTRSLLQYCSITSYLRFIRFCSLSGENLQSWLWLPVLSCHTFPSSVRVHTNYHLKPAQACSQHFLKQRSQTWFPRKFQMKIPRKERFSS